MSVAKQLLCSHQFEPMSLHLGDETLIKKCEKCGRRIEERMSSESTTTH